MTRQRAVKPQGQPNCSEIRSLSMNPGVLPASCRQTNRRKALPARCRQHLGGTVSLSETPHWCGVSEIIIHSLRSNWPGARREGGSVSAAILDRLSNEAPGQFQRNPKGGISFGRRRCCSLLTDPLRDMLWCPCGSTSRLASAQNPLPRMYSYFGDTTRA